MERVKEKIPVFSFYAKDGLYWFRLFGVGIEINHKSNKLTYCQLLRRRWRGRYFRIGSWYFRYLKKQVLYWRVLFDGTKQKFKFNDNETRAHDDYYIAKAMSHFTEHFYETLIYKSNN